MTIPGGEETRSETALPPPRGNRIDEAEEEETAGWGRAVPAGRPRRVLEVPEASAMAGVGRGVPEKPEARRKQQAGRGRGEKRSGGSRAARILGAFFPTARPVYTLDPKILSIFH